MTLLALRGLTAGHGSVPVVRDVDLTVDAGEVVALLGANGAGKTTTLLTVSGILAPLGGEIEVLGTVLRRHRRHRRGRPARPWLLARRGLAHVPEDRSLFFGLTVAENLRLGRRPRTPSRLDAVLDLLPALRPLLRRPAGLLSGGEQQMLALGRALTGEPRLLLVDEMSSGLAPLIVARLLPVMRTVAEETGAGVLLVEQQVAMALSVSDRAYVLRRGVVAASGPAAELAAQPELLQASYLGG